MEKHELFNKFVEIFKVEDQVRLFFHQGELILLGSTRITMEEMCFRLPSPSERMEW